MLVSGSAACAAVIPPNYKPVSCRWSCCPACLPHRDRGSITCKIMLASAACWSPGARASDMEANLRVLASCREKQGLQAHNTTGFSSISAMLAPRMFTPRRSEIPEGSRARTFEVVRKRSWHQLIVSGPSAVRGDDEMESTLINMSLDEGNSCENRSPGTSVMF